MEEQEKTKLIMTSVEMKLVYRMNFIKFAAHSSPGSNIYLYQTVTFLLSLPTMKERLKAKLGDEYENVMSRINKFQAAANWVETWAYEIKKIGEDRPEVAEGVPDHAIPDLLTHRFLKRINSQIKELSTRIPSLSADLIRVYILAIQETDLQNISIPQHEVMQEYKNKSNSFVRNMREGSDSPDMRD